MRFGHALLGGAVCTLVFFAAGAAFSAPAVPAPGDVTVAVRGVDLTVTPGFVDTPPSANLVVKAQLTIEGLAASTAAVAFNLDEFTIDAVEDGSGELQYSFAHDPAGGPAVLSVNLRDPLAAGMQKAITIRYHGTPSCTADPVAGYAGCRLEKTLSHLHGRTVFPRKVPASDADDRDLFLLRAGVVLPKGLHAVAGAEFDGEFDDGSGSVVSKWHTDLTDAIAVAFGEYNVGESVYPAAGGGTFTVGTFAQIMTNASAAGYRDIAADALGWFSARYGAYGAPGFGLAEIAGATPAIATAPGFGFMPQSLLGGEPDEFGAAGVVARSTVGQWWGVKVRPAGPGARWITAALSEFSSLGFESYRYASSVPDYLTYVKYLYQTMYEYGVRPDEDVPLASAAAADLDWSDFALIVSWKGAMVFSQLEAILGARFYPALESFANAFDNGWAATDDLRAVLEDAHGSSLLWYFDEWVNGTGFPVYTLSWDVKPEGLLYRVDITLRQQAAAGAGGFDMPVEFAVYGEGGSTAARIGRRASDIDETYTVSVVEKPVSVVMDPEGKLPLKRVASAVGGDIDIDMEVDGRDLLYAAWSHGGTFADFAAGRNLRFVTYTDLNRDGLVDDTDLDVVLDNFGACALSECASQ